MNNSKKAWDDYFARQKEAEAKYRANMAELSISLTRSSARKTGPSNSQLKAYIYSVDENKWNDNYYFAEFRDLNPDKSPDLIDIAEFELEQVQVDYYWALYGTPPSGVPVSTAMGHAIDKNRRKQVTADEINRARVEFLEKDKAAREKVEKLVHNTRQSLLEKANPFQNGVDREVIDRIEHAKKNSVKPTGALLMMNIDDLEKVKDRLSLIEFEAYKAGVWRDVVMARAIVAECCNDIQSAPLHQFLGLMTEDQALIDLYIFEARHGIYNPFPRVSYFGQPRTLDPWKKYGNTNQLPDALEKMLAARSFTPYNLRPSWKQDIVLQQYIH